MTITRDGNEYTLTNVELVQAFDEVLRMRYEDEVRDYLDGWDDKLDEWFRAHEGEYEELVLDIVDELFYWFESYGDIMDDERIHEHAYDALENHGIIADIYGEEA